MEEKTLKRIAKFSSDRDWEKFHTPANLAKTILIEASELLECFQWDDNNYNLEHVKEELADVIINSQNLADKLHLNVDEIVNKKMEQNEKKYPIDKVKGVDKKI